MARESEARIVHHCLLFDQLRGLPAVSMAEALRALASEQDCYLCGATASQPVCPVCIAALPRLPAGICPGCALPSATGGACGRCIASPPHYDATVAALAYGDPLDHALQGFKYRHALGLARFLASLLDAAIGGTGSTLKVDLVVPMPLARPRLAQRGFNQALELARPIAARRGLRLDPLVVRRTLDAPAQAGLPWKERARNIKGAFACDAALGGLRVAVVDDVMTTGATLDELARVLKQAGAAHVTNWVVARTLPHAPV
jgi:ComF family protein